MSDMVRVRVNPRLNHRPMPEKVVKSKPVLPAGAGAVIEVTQAELDSFPDKFTRLDEVAVAEEPALIAPVTLKTPARVNTIRATAQAKKLARDGGIDLSQVVGTGSDGLITKADVTVYSLGGN